MGGLFSAKFEINNNIPGQTANVFNVAGILGYSRSEINSLFRRFVKCDAPHPGKMTETEFVAAHRFVYDWAGRLAFHSSHYDDIDSEIDFENYIIIVWNFCTSSPAQIASIIFKHFKQNSSEFMLDTEVDTMVDTLMGKKQEKKVHSAFKIDGHETYGDISEKEFVRITHTNQAVLFPAIDFQRQLRLSVLGTKTWRRHSQRRDHLYPSRTIDAILGPARSKNLKKCKPLPVMDISIMPTTTEPSIKRDVLMDAVDLHVHVAHGDPFQMAHDRQDGYRSATDHVGLQTDSNKRSHTPHSHSGASTPLSQHTVHPHSLDQKHKHRHHADTDSEAAESDRHRHHSHEARHKRHPEPRNHYTDHAVDPYDNVSALHSGEHARGIKDSKVVPAH